MLMVPNEGKIFWAKRCLYSNAASEDISARLFQNNVTPAETDVAATYTVSSFTGYANVTLTSSQSGATWAVPTVSSNIASSQHGTNAVYTAGSDQTAYGIYFVAASGGQCVLSQAFGAGKPLVGATADTITVVPKIQFSHI